MKGTSRRPIAHFHVERLVEDMALRGWNNEDLARASGLSSMTISKFIRGECRTAKTSFRLAQALGYSARRYLSHVEVAA